MISEGLKLVIYGVTDVGRNREHNEDAIAWDMKSGLALLADGMGGHNAGEVASALAVDSVKTSLASIVSPEIVASGIVNFGDALRDAVDFANQEIHEQSQERPECAGMGTTMAVALFVNHQIILAHVGDSRIYRFRGNALEQITSDHSLVQEMIDNGYLSEEEAQLSTSRNLITRALGIGEQVDIDICEDSTEIGDIYLLCSDGLSDMVPDVEIMQVLLHNTDDVETAAQILVDLANEKGGADNISVILAAMYKAYDEDTILDDSTTLEIERGK